MSKLLAKEQLERFWAGIKAKLAEKYDKAGGEITGLAIFKAGARFFIADDDYDAGINITSSLPSNDGPVLTFGGYANSQSENTNYRPILRNIASPNQNYDVANKKYVDEHNVSPDVYFVFLNADGTVDQKSSSLTYANVAPKVTSYSKAVYLDVIINNTRFYVKALEMTDVNNGPVKFVGLVDISGVVNEVSFTLDQNDTISVILLPIEKETNKVQDLVANRLSPIFYPSTKAVYDYAEANFQRKPVVVWEVDGINVTTGLKALQADLTANPSWQLTGLDLTPYKRIKIYAKAGKGTTNASTTPSIVLEMMLDPRLASSAWGNNYCGSVLAQKPNDSNRYASLTCAVSADKTKFAVLRQTSLYGTAATTNNDIGADVVLIEGYYD